VITIQNSFLVDKPVADVFALFSRMDKLAWAFPTVTRVDVIDNDTVNLGVMLKLGLLPLDNNLSLRVSERTAPRRLVAEGNAVPGAGLASAARIADKNAFTRICMVLDLVELETGKTRVLYKITADAHGNLKRIYEAIIKGQRTKLEGDFIKNVAKILGAPIVEEAGGKNGSSGS
jgi:carbon monoxide dehydrogenase subunit G